MVGSCGTKQPDRNQLKNRLLSGGKLGKISGAHGFCWNDGVVIADLPVITHNIYRNFGFVVRFQCGCINTDFLRYLRNEGRKDRLHVLRQISAVGTGIGH